MFAGAAFVGAVDVENPRAFLNELTRLILHIGIISFTRLFYNV
jgi:hypothetical protein